jgi:hypothetical protein
VAGTHDEARGGGSVGAALVTRAGGYLLDVDRNSVDLDRFRELVAQARPAVVALVRTVDGRVGPGW